MNKDQITQKIIHHFQPSKINSLFSYANLSFPDYCVAIEKVFQTVKKQYNLDITDEKIKFNLPFEWHPETPNGKGVLLIHGLFDTPFIMRDIAKHLLHKGYLVRSILLPGHGTVPADLLTTSYKEWIKATQYGIDSFKKDVENIYIAGFSTGAALALHHILHEQPDLPHIQGLLMFSPAIAISTKNAFLVRIYRMFRWVLQKKKWVERTECPDYTKYTSFPVNSAFPVQRLIVENNIALQSKTFRTPLFMAVSLNDETINPQAALNFFLSTYNSNNKCIVYSNNSKKKYSDIRIHIQPSQKMDENILDMSHVAVVNSPDNFHYGRNGDHQEPIHIPKEDHHDTRLYLGALTQKNENHYRIRRLTFNPFFSELMESLDEFLERNA